MNNKEEFLQAKMDSDRKVSIMSPIDEEADPMDKNEEISQSRKNSERKVSIMTPIDQDIDTDMDKNEEISQARGNSERKVSIVPPINKGWGGKISGQKSQVIKKIKDNKKSVPEPQNEDVVFMVEADETGDDPEVDRVLNKVTTNIMINCDNDPKQQIMHIEKLNDILAGKSWQSGTEEYLHECVRKNKLENLRELLKVFKNNTLTYKLNKNYLDNNKKSALRLAIDRRNEDVLKLFLKNGHGRSDCILYAIKTNYVKGVKIILKYKPEFKDKKISEDNIYFRPGMTPMLYAAKLGRYEILKILSDKGAQLDEKQRTNDDRNKYWDDANEWNMLYEAKSNAAYITMMLEKEKKDPFVYCMKTIREIKKYHKRKHEFDQDDCGGFIINLEKYMCNLLDQVRSAEELSVLYKYKQVEKNRGENLFNFSVATVDTDALDLLEKANKDRLIDFVTHQQSQLALSHLCHRSIQTENSNTRRFVALILGIIYPFLSLFNVFFPNTVPGQLITTPMIALSSHMMSDIGFVALLVVNMLSKNIQSEKLGEPFSAVQILIGLWIAAKLLVEIEECRNRGYKEYFKDAWNYNDILLLIFFTLSIIFRFVDWIKNRSETESNIVRTMWASNEPKLISEALQAIGYVFVFLRVSALVRVQSSLGPLHISLARMLSDVLRFLLIFCLVIFAFAMGLSDLYWYYGTTEGKGIYCSSSQLTNSSQPTCESSSKTPFTNPLTAMYTLFWALFNYMELSSLNLNGKHSVTQSTGIALVGFYHVVAITVMLNMLIAMMNRSYERTSENEELEWKFHRTTMWIRFIRDEVVLPPPMTLIPRPTTVASWFKSCRRRGNFMVNLRKSINIEHILENMPSKDTLYRELVANLVQRYKFNNLVEREIKVTNQRMSVYD